MGVPKRQVSAASGACLHPTPMPREKGQRTVSVIDPSLPRPGSDVARGRERVGISKSPSPAKKNRMVSLPGSFKNRPTEP